MTAPEPVVTSVGLRDEHRALLAAWDVQTVDLAAGSPPPTGAAAVALAGAAALLVDSHATVDGELLALAPRVRVISTVSVGYDHIDLAAAARRGITVTHTPVLSDAVADLTLALVLMLARRLRTAVDLVARGGWDDALLGADLRDKTLLLVGLGRIGQEVARRALAFKMHVCGFDTRADLALPSELAAVERVPTLAAGLARADFVSLHVDLNDTTRHLVDDAALARMKPTAFLVNTARGAIVDQAALTRALVDGRIAGAGLDVLEHEPPAADDPLLAMPNVVVLSHIGSATVETRRRMLDCAVENLATCLRGDPCRYALALP